MLATLQGVGKVLHGGVESIPLLFACTPQLSTLDQNALPNFSWLVEKLATTRLPTSQPSRTSWGTASGSHSAISKEFFYRS